MYPNPKDMTPRETYKRINKEIHRDKDVRRIGLILVALAAIAAVIKLIFIR